MDSHTLTKRLLKLKKFKGNFTEKRLCREINEYKDAITVPAGSNFALDLQMFMDILYAGDEKRWIGISLPDDETDPYTIWTVIHESDLPFGEYYFQVRSVKFTDQTIQLKLKVVKSTEVDSSDGGSKTAVPAFDLSAVDWNQLHPRLLVERTIASLIDIELISLTRQTINFMLVTILYLFTEIPNLIRFVGLFVLRLVRELNNFIYVSTPIMMGLFNLCAKIFGGILLMINSFRREAAYNRNKRQLAPLGFR